MKNSKTVSKPVTGETANFIGYVKYTLLLQNNTLMNGNYNTTTGEQPGSIVYDPSNKFLYTANDYMNAATIINGTNNSVITNVTVGNTPDAISYDPVQKYIYVSNFNSSDVSALNTSTNSVTSIGVDQYPADSVYVGSAKSVYVDISAFNEVEIINPVTGTTTATKIPVGTSPVGIAYDPAENYLFVANAQSHNVTVINVATNSVIANISVGSTPVSVLYNPFNDYIYVANYWSNNITVIKGNSQLPSIVTTIKLNTAPFGMSYDPNNGYIYIADHNTSNITVVDSSNNTIMGNITVGYKPDYITYDYSNQYLYVTNSVSGTVSIISTSSPAYAVTFTESGLPAGTNWSVSINNNTPIYSITDKIVFNLYNGQYYYKVYPERGYVATPSSGDFSVNGNAINIAISWSSAIQSLYSVTFTESGLPAGTNWSVSLNNSVKYSTSTDIIFKEPNGTYTYLVEYITGYVATPSHGSVNINGKNITQPISWAIGTAYSVTFNETGLSSRTNWSVSVSGYTKYTTTTSIQFMLTNGTYPFTVGPIPNYSPSPTSGNVNVSGASVSKTITWSSSSASLYTIKFIESGLPASTVWYVILSGITGSSSTNTITFKESNGTYTFNIGNSNYIATPSSGSITVNGRNTEQNISFTIATKYTVDFTETGLSTGTSWSVTLNTIYTKSSINNTVIFNVVNGTYNYTIGIVHGYRATPSSGQFKVNGVNTNIVINFSIVRPVVYTVTFTETGLPSGTNWSVTLNNFNKSGTGKFIIFKEINGSYPFTITSIKGYNISQPTGIITVNKNVTENVTFTPVSLSSSSSGISSESTIIYVIIIFIILALLILMIFYRDKTTKVAKHYIDKGKNIVLKMTNNKNRTSNTKEESKNLTSGYSAPQPPASLPNTKFATSSVPYKQQPTPYKPTSGTSSTSMTKRRNATYTASTSKGRYYNTKSTPVKNRSATKKTAICPSCHNEIPMLVYICPICKHKIR
ncbi:MAG: YncE family protein [Candidatus Thermoplasmatota archaeon]|nr:YncE family protein [Candidatus Thermoplasmatota archaeon]